MIVSLNALVGLWGKGLGFILHMIIPECRAPKYFKFTHPHMSLTGVELRNFFETIDFSMLLFDSSHIQDIFYRLPDFVEWLKNNVILISNSPISY